MRLRSPLLILLALAVAALAALPGRAAAPPPDRIAPELQAQLDTLAAAEQVTAIVTLKDQTDLGRIGGGDRAARRRGLLQALQAKARNSQAGLLAWLQTRQARGEVSQVTPLWVFNGLSVTATAAVMSDLAARPEVKWLTPDVINIAVQGPLMAEPAEANLALLGAPALWDLGWRGQSVVVAHLDTGVDVNHSDFVTRWRGGPNSWFDPYGQYPSTPTDLNGHGTQTLGVLVGGNASGSAVGVAPQAQWIAARIFNNQGAATATALHLAFQWVLDPDGDPLTDDAPQVVNNSWSFGGPGCNLEFQADLQALRAADIVPVFAAGNYGPYANTSVSPANYPEALAVGAIGNSSQLYGASSRGPSACGEAAATYPDLAAPGINVLTTDLYGQYFSVTGTSLAAPHVAGALALLLSAYPNLTAAQQEAALWAGAVDLGPAGPDNDTGRGRLDVLAAYQWLQTQPDATPVPPTATPIPSTATPLPPTATNTNTPPPPTATPTLDVIFADGFEAGDLTGWTASVIDGGDLSVTTGAALNGGFGMQAVLDDNTALYLTDDTPASEPRYRARFYFDPNSLPMASGNAHFILYGYAGASTVVARMELRFSSPNYQLRASVNNDSNTWSNTAWATITDAAHFVELDWRASTAAGANNGGITYWIDGVQQGNVTTIDNDTRRIDRVRLGAIAGIDSGTRGTYFFDAFESRRLTYIGPVAAPTPTATPPLPTATPLPPTSTPIPPTATPPPPTTTPIPPTATPPPPTTTPIPPTATPMPPTATPGADNFALSFDGTNDLVAGAAVPGTGPLTVEAWVRPAAVGETGVLIANGDANTGWSLELENGRPIFWVATNQGWQSLRHTTALLAGQWTHVAATYASGAIRVFVNGAPAGPATVGATLTQGPDLRLGGLAGYAYFAGALDDVRLSNIARYTAAFPPPTTVTVDANTVGGWTFNAGVGQTAVDASASANTLTLGGSTAVGADDPVWITRP